MISTHSYACPPHHHLDPATSVNGGDLYDSLKAAGRLAEDVAKPIFAQLLAAIHYMHKKNVSHRWVDALMSSSRMFVLMLVLLITGDCGGDTVPAIAVI